MIRNHVNKERLGLERLLTGLAFLGMGLVTVIWGVHILESDATVLAKATHLTFIGIMGSGYVVYLMGRWGYLARLKAFFPADHGEMSSVWKKSPSITYLLPSYKEEVNVVKMSLLSSALQLYPDKRVVLLIDDPPSDDPQLVLTRALPKQIEQFLEGPREHLKKIYHSTKDAKKAHRYLAAWFQTQGELYPVTDAQEKAFVELTFFDRAAYHKTCEHTCWDELLGMFNVEVTSFERKQFEYLSHAANKAMNLNSYIGLMGEKFPETEFVAMLDADTILTHDYTLRLVHHMISPGQERLAVIQTPYSAFPNAAGELERVAGITTDLQFVVHQGFTHYNATFWVGANAIARKSALDDIVEEVQERGYTIKRFIQDRTVIEDTESSVDLIRKGWSLHNYPERLSYSATPPDFGSLLIQRRRWANGGLLILPKLFGSLSNWKEGFMRMHYLGSIGVTLGALLTLLIVPFSAQEITWAAIVSPLPYLAIYGRDLMLLGYRFTDLFRVLALNVLLIPVNAAGVLKSLEQAVTGQQIPFFRTPKVKGKTLVPRFYRWLNYSLAGWMMIAFYASLFYLPPLALAPNLFMVTLTAYALPKYLMDFSLKIRWLN
ncbi:MAG: glycosyltransferase [Chlamydiia bacterium]|nr:glycosyltransferase [Chlamydiia bacterium]